jgi:hypothetical protein
MRRVAFWSSLSLPSAIVVWGAWFGTFPFGVRGEWEWMRIAPDGPLGLSLVPPIVAAALYLGFVWLGQRRIPRCGPAEISAWLCGLVVAGFTWLWIVQESAPRNYDLSKAVWVLYFRGSSGYFLEARDAAQNLPEYLSRYEDKMAEGDVLHIGTHPPGLIVIFRGLLSLCERSEGLVDLVVATEPDSVREAFDELRRTALRPTSPFVREHEAVLWLAALFVQAGAALTVVPLFGLLRRGLSRRPSWLATAFWPAVPALAMFVPKSDCLFPLVSAALLWLWLEGLDRQSLQLAAATGLAFCVSLSLSLAFLPVALIAALIGIGRFVAPRLTMAGTPEIAPAIDRLPIGRRAVAGLKMAFAAAIGFVAPCLLSWALWKINFLMIWWLNFRNHGGFYEQYPRTYWKWVLINPFEFAVAAGVPLTVLAVWGVVRQWRQTHGRLEFPVWAALGVVAALWLSGKNMGEVARLWILFIPLLVWFAGPIFEASVSTGNEPPSARAVPVGAVDSAWLSGQLWIAALALQLATATALVTRVAGFHYP